MTPRARLGLEPVSPRPSLVLVLDLGLVLGLEARPRQVRMPRGDTLLQVQTLTSKKTLVTRV